MTTNPGPIGHVRLATEGNLFDLGFAEIRIVLAGDDTGGAFAMSQQVLRPRTLAGPLHRHTNEKGFIQVLRGVVGGQLDGDVVHAEPGATIFVPQNVSHTFWNETADTAEVLEIFTPAGLEGWFRELAEIVSSESPGLQEIVESARRYGTELDLDSLQPLLQTHGLIFPGLPTAEI